jgi:histidyl-tRNA synthetase
MEKPSLPKGTRDFGPSQMLKRNYLLQTIREVFVTYGFLPIETPSMENLSVLTGKYGDEGDQLIFKILNSGDYLDKISTSDIEEGYKKLLPKISKKALRYDLTVPFARFVVMNRNDITFPFKRYQIQPVWRSDRPQKGRYCEFYQCDADVIGTPSLLCEAEIIMMIHTVFKKLNFNDFLIKVNNRKILAGIAEVLGKKGSENDLCVAIDKLDKIGIEAVKKNY